MEYAVTYGKGKYMQRGGFKNLKSARKYAYDNTAKTHNSSAVFEILSPYDQDLDGVAVYRNGEIHYKNTSDKTWVLKKDGTLGEKIK